MTKTQLINDFRESIIGTPIDDGMIWWLDKRGYFDAPASKGHHLAEPGGLCVHSIGVMNHLEELTDKLGLKWQRPCSPVIIGLFHDLCKMDAYIPVYGQTMKTYYMGGNVADEGGEKFVQRYEWNDCQLINGHGDKSVMIASQLLRLTDEEVMCIRYHMGAFSEDEKERSAYSNAVKAYPNVLWTHTADMWASNIEGK